MRTKEIVSVVTPTYNRAYILNKCYESLKIQTSKSFVWMIVDDGSTDNTEELVNQWLNEGILDIHYFKKKNGGKASALNLALDKVDSDYFVCLDSDDTFAYNAIELALKQLQQIKKNKKYCGILALRTAPNGEVLGGKQIPDGIKETTLSEISNKFKMRSELICFYKTGVISQHRFPEIQGENFISPAYIEHELGKMYKFLVSRNTFCYCEYLPDGLTKNKRNVIKKNPKGYTLVKHQSFELAEDFKAKSKHCVLYISGCILSRDKDWLKKSPHKIMTIVYFPLGWLVYKLRYR
ncbi:glycosyltransferase family A protein [Peribacillus simplex]|uniref:Glycosyltransferase family A protein n=1 Tax=Peribacillus simplex TaxID=1478 RepID=A0AAW7ICS3_9BACI|nr:glycosyltransferase family A protein [Peribacillus simplex]MDM5452708.1 glycosyltransferase family A protein [Peribacillus simplex]